MISNEVADELKRLSRRIDSQGKLLDLLNKDREIFEDILNRLSAVENALKMQRSNQTEMAKDIRAGIGEVQEVVEAKIDEVNLSADNKTVIVKSPRESVIKKIVNKVTGR